MAKEYFKFSRKHFEYELRGILIHNKLGRMEDYTDEFIAEGNQSFEKIYKLKSRNPAVEVLIYSSVDVTENKVRSKGSDAVRVVLCWNTKKGKRYKRVAKHLRIETLFKNLENTLLGLKEEVFDLKWNDFSDKPNV
jgi:hypothetical protein